MTIWFDLDGTLVRTYEVENWLDYLHKEDVFPYANARPLGNMQSLARKLNTLRKKGYTIGVISWGSKTSSEAYLEAVCKAKKEWLSQHLHSVNWDIIHVVEYGTSKVSFRKTPQDILFDDECGNREEWGANAFPPELIMQILNSL